MRHAGRSRGGGRIRRRRLRPRSRRRAPPASRSASRAGATPWAASSSPSGAVLHRHAADAARSSGSMRERGIVEVEAGIQWPELVERLIAMQKDRAPAMGHRPEADRRRPAVARRRARRQHPRPRPDAAADHRRRRVVHPHGRRRRAAHLQPRPRTRELFRLAIGGYGLFGVVTRVRLRLMPRTKLERVVEIIDIDELMPAFDRAHRRGLSSTAIASSRPTRRPTTSSSSGVFSCYRPLPADAAMPAEQQGARRARTGASSITSRTPTRGAPTRPTPSYYLSTSGQRYWSDTHQMSVYHRRLPRGARPPAAAPSTRAREMITELYVPRAGAAGVPRRRARGFPAARRAAHLRHDPPDRAGRRELPRLGARAVGLHGHQPARRPHAGRHRARRPATSAA